MKKLLLTLLCVLVLAPLAHAETRYIKGVSTASYLDKQSGDYLTVPLRVFVATGQGYADDLIYIEGGLEGERKSGYVFEVGRRGLANENTYFERARFEKALRKCSAWIKDAQEKGADRVRHPDIFDSFDLEFQPLDGGKNARCAMKIWDIEHGGSVQLYLDTEQIEGLLALLAKAPEALEPLKKEIAAKELEHKERIRKSREAAGLE